MYVTALRSRLKASFNLLKTFKQRVVQEEHFQYDTTSSVFQREQGLARFLRPSSRRRQLFEAALLFLWAIALVVVLSVFFFWLR
jgi:hypothetical protein